MVKNFSINETPFNGNNEKPESKQNVSQWVNWWKFFVKMFKSFVIFHFLDIVFYVKTNEI